jgi:anthranilate phosphoribosyltransferase
MADKIRPWLKRINGAITGGRTYNLSESEAQELFHLFLDGAGTDAQLAVFLSVMRSKGTTAEELVGAARAARSRIVFPQLPENCVVVATSRLGKRTAPPLGLAAAAAAAAAGVPVLLQASTRLRWGGLTSGDLWQEMCGPLTGDAHHVESMFDSGPLACWNPTIYDAGWQRLQRIEDETLLRGIPDVVTKLLVPGGSRSMSAAVPGPVLGIAANAQESLQHRHALIVQGFDGSIDPSTLETTRGMRIVDGVKAPLRIHPGDVALFESDEPHFLSDNHLKEAASVTHQVLLGVASPALSSTLLSAGLMISLAKPNDSVATCVALAGEAIRSGAAQRLLESFRD